MIRMPLTVEDDLRLRADTGDVQVRSGRKGRVRTVRTEDVNAGSAGTTGSTDKTPDAGSTAQKDQITSDTPAGLGVGGVGIREIGLPFSVDATVEDPGGADGVTAGPTAALPEDACRAAVTLDPDQSSAPASSSSASDEIVPVDLWSPCPPFTYLAGPAGCGKTFASKLWAASQPGFLLCATTGIAALNLGGQTINGTLGYFDTRDLQEKWQDGRLAARLSKLWHAGIRRLVLDEVSMLDGDQLTFLVEAIETINGRGYVIHDSHDGPAEMGLTLVGDFAQLPPVEGIFAFESPEWKRTDQNNADRFAESTITLTEIRRQADPDFITALRAARVGDTKTVLDYFGPRIQRQTDDTFNGPTIFAKNETVDRHNWLRLNRLEGEQVIFPATREGKQRSEWGNPDKPPNTWGIPPRLNLKVGALVMILANKRKEVPLDVFHGLTDAQFERKKLAIPFLYVNGDLGELVDADVEGHTAHVRLHRTGQVVDVDYVRREMTVPLDAARRRELRDQGKTELITENGKFEIVGWVSYMPLRVAWATTVHKSQGLSLDEVQVNITDAFFKASGMIYVALSRARTAEGLRLVGTAAALAERCTVNPKLKSFL